MIMKKKIKKLGEHATPLGKKEMLFRLFITKRICVIQKHLKIFSIKNGTCMTTGGDPECIQHGEKHMSTL